MTESLTPKVPVRKCPNCSYVDRHPLVWCSNCGSRYDIVLMTHDEYQRLTIEQSVQIFWENKRGEVIQRKGGEKC